MCSVLNWTRQTLSAVEVQQDMHSGAKRFRWCGIDFFVFFGRVDLVGIVALVLLAVLSLISLFDDSSLMIVPVPVADLYYTVCN